ncbi:phosphate-starvation-inducible PsiE family protein [Gilvimarinus sp. DA14]|uniref:phosphate-starvation-inducible PsiE family protein n=1 Tax=Gilvimarinus sp. DA14 TaxID=2956798 RepID=UPI0020B6F225|nr:phosphate-starvation-inducible PsiE family protein [Gilvimarinus sp. DA14]UTF61103.1 phosphate-starvation-inducible PsiE family protein [Gilvimarinus sp. DA14]
MSDNKEPVTPPNSAEKHRHHELHQELPVDFPDAYFRGLHRIIRFAIRVLALLMVFVILWGVVDVVYIIYERLITAPVLLLNINDIFYTFGAFMAVLIAVEIFINIRLYLGTNVFPVQLVVATALMAIARKVIVLDFDAFTPMYLLGIAATTLALGITYWLLNDRTRNVSDDNSVAPR